MRDITTACIISFLTFISIPAFAAHDHHAGMDMGHTETHQSRQSQPELDSPEPAVIKKTAIANNNIQAPPKPQALPKNNELIHSNALDTEYKNMTTKEIYSDYYTDTPKYRK